MFLVIGYDVMFSYEEVIANKRLLSYVADKQNIYYDNRHIYEDTYGSIYGGYLRYTKVKSKDIENIKHFIKKHNIFIKGSGVSDSES